MTFPGYLGSHLTQKLPFPADAPGSSNPEWSANRFNVKRLAGQMAIGNTYGP
jgi:hypothetical protein